MLDKARKHFLEEQHECPLGALQFPHVQPAKLAQPCWPLTSPRPPQGCPHHQQSQENTSNPRPTVFIEVLKPPRMEGEHRAASPGSVQGPEHQTSSISTLTGAKQGFCFFFFLFSFPPFVHAGCDAKEGALKACGTCAKRRG